ncbi:aspartate/glutamate racemase family protein [Galbibacter sp. PAP.153]|uniref:aspartate/glutamate racemase family protein n=1 Tax=Galbibacter sp. PAP.153 TaxID=3104623 RepID=UPI00300A3D69
MKINEPCQNCCEIALRLANNFSVIIGRWKWEDQMRESIESYGYGNHLRSFRAVGLTPPEFITNPDAGQKIIDASIAAVNEDHAESIILGCTLETGFYLQVQNEILAQTGSFVPVIDASIGALKTAEHAASLKLKSSWKTSKLWGLEPPSETEMASFNIFQTPYEFGNLIVVE